MKIPTKFDEADAGALVSDAVGYKGYSGRGDANDLLGAAKHAKLKLAGGVRYRDQWDMLAKQIPGEKSPKPQSAEEEIGEELGLDAPSILMQKGSWYYLSDGTKHNGLKALERYLERFKVVEEEVEE